VLVFYYKVLEIDINLHLVSGGDTKAYKETAQWKIKTNKEVIMKMRQQSKEYRTHLAKSKAVSKLD
jgi:hypothetical protein